MKSKPFTRFTIITVLLVLVLGTASCQIPIPTPVSTVSTPVPLIPQTGATVSAPTTAVIQHQVTPPAGLPGKRVNHAGDQDSSASAPQKIAPGGDKFSTDLFERPFNANTMNTYFPYLDIIDTQIFQDDIWTYATITLKGPGANKLFPGQYALELDTNLDGRGDWLIVASKPASANWTTDGVQVFQDANHDVGGQTPGRPDTPPGGDGYETLVFDQGKGNDPDAAWARVSSDLPNTVEIAVKRSVFNSKQYLANVWAGNSLDPHMFDPNDHFTADQAGSPLADLNTYPIKSIAEIDNTCRMAIGFVPTGAEPGLCITIQPKVPGPGQPQPGQPKPPAPPPVPGIPVPP